MAPLFIAGCIACVIFLAGTVNAAFSGRTELQRFCKPLASAGFLVAAIGAGAFSTTFGTVIFVGLVFCLIGDVLLMWKEKGPFMAGIFAFLLGHVAYLLAFVMRGQNGLTAVLALIAILPIAVFILRWLWEGISELKIPVIAYIVVIALMVTTAVGTFGFAASWPILLGAIAFFVSDLFVARERFVGSAFFNRAVGLPLYYGAQLTIAYAAGTAAL
ncbi:MAG: putative membrane protein YhhN [Bradymonadia bacterium]|jgi:uncharacterized membrane protein YhhN